MEESWQAWQIVTGIVVFIFVVLGSGAGARAWVDRRVEGERQDRIAHLSAEKQDRNIQLGAVLAKADEAQKRAHELELATRDAVHDVSMKAAQALHDLELRVAKEYASFKAMNAVKDDIMDSMGEVKESVNKIGDRMDQILLERATAA